MWGIRNKKNKALRNWHSRGLLIDPRKTKITIISTEKPILVYVADDRTVDDQQPFLVNIEESFSDDSAENIGNMDEISGIPVLFSLVDA